MKRFFRSRLVNTLAVAIIAGLAGSWAAGAVRDRYEVATMKIKTVCVGRFLIDLPDEARVSLAGQRIDGIDIDTSEETEEAFWARVATREAEIRAKPDRLGGNKNLESVTDVKTETGLVGKIFVHSRKVTAGQSSDGFTVEHYHYENVAVEAIVHANGISVDLWAAKYNPDLIGRMPKLLAKLVTNPGNRIPTEPGYCFDRVYVRDPLTAKQGERLIMRAGLPTHPDIQFMLMMLAGTKPDEKGLLARSAESDAARPLAVRMRISKLRAALRTIAGLTGDELVERFFEENNSIGYSFWWEVNGTEDNVLIPSFSFQMTTGHGNREPVPTSLSEGAAIALWDKITNSIRFRPTESPKVSAAGPATQLGAVASAGDTCPADGWWECSAGANGVAVHGGQRQYIRQGQRMPQALLLPPQTLWEKVRGLQSSYEDTRPTPWRLVDRRSRRRVVPDVPLAQAMTAALAAATAAAGSVERASVGIYAITGNVCPAAGWWRCEESDALDGTRWFAQGALLPAATFAVPAGVFGMATGTPKATQRRGTWQLVRLAQAPDADNSAGKTTDQDQGGNGLDSTPGGASHDHRFYPGDGDGST
jgi:hypothetical protein